VIISIPPFVPPSGGSLEIGNKYRRLLP